jgi:prevent-host-death family protein
MLAVGVTCVAPRLAQCPECDATSTDQVYPLLTVAKAWDFDTRPLKDYIRSMRYSTQIRPISYLKANAAEVLQELADQRQPMVITQNGEARAVLQDVASYEQTQETLALLKILALGNQQLAQGRVKPLADIAKRIRAKVATGD